jgi:hypothetical protein
MIYIENNKNKIIIILLLFILVNSCNNNNKISKINLKIDSLNNKVVPFKQLHKIIVLEGLKNEKRMIQSTDRKILDLNREKEIDKEIKTLE